MPKALTRDELQEQTRELIIAAAERVFLARGYLATTIAQIAEEAGRTHGSIYGNFAGKEDLCLQVLRRHFEQVLRDLATAVLAADGQAAALTALRQRWAALLGQPAWIRLAADFLIATRSDPGQGTANRETLDGFALGIATLIRAQAAAFGGPAVDPEVLDRATATLLATGAGLAVGHALGATPREVATVAFVETVELWLSRLGITPDVAG
jgi:AcrR family transcriptional regulator